MKVLTVGQQLGDDSVEVSDFCQNMLHFAVDFADTVGVCTRRSWRPLTRVRQAF